MADRLADIESRLAAIERRLSALEGTPRRVAAPEEPLAAPALREGSVSNAATHLGRVLLIFGGAYLLRAITDYDIVPTGIGIFLGAVYAVLWLFMAYRTAGNPKRRASAVFFGVASILLALPLAVEAITRFELLSGPQGAMALTVFCALVLAVAAVRNLRSLGWLVTAGGIATAIMLVKAAQTAVPVGAFLLLLGLGALWASYTRKWRGPQWLGGLGADLGVVVLALVGTSEQWAVEPVAAWLLGVALMLSFLVSFAIRTHVQREAVGLFEPVQAVLSLGVMMLAAVKALQAGQFNLGLVGALSLLLGIGGYALAFTPETRAARGRNFFFYSTLGLVFVVVGTALMLSPGKAAAIWSLMALVMAWFSGRYGRVTLSLQCTFLLIAAGVGSGLLATGIEAFAGNALESWPPPVIWHPIVALITVACLFIPVAQHSERWGVMAGLPQLIVLALSVWEVGGLMVAYLAPVLAGVPGPEANLGVLAALRTGVLSAASVTLALSSLYRRWPEARWLAYPVLIVVGVKLAVEDFPNGQPVTLFVALALVGSALLLVSKLMRARRDETGEAPV